VLLDCIREPKKVRDRKARCQALKYTLMGGELYCRIIDGLLLKCLSKEQAKVAMEEVHEGMYGTHQSAHKMKWMLKRAGFYWPTMMEDCFTYFKGCEACQRFRDVQLAPTSMGLGFRIRRGDPPFIIKGAPFYLGSQRLLYQICC
jgi:hypothetical protein